MRASSAAAPKNRLTATTRRESVGTRGAYHAAQPGGGFAIREKLKETEHHMTIEGLHHITIGALDAQRTVDFYTTVLGLRFVKKTVNFDDPGTYHLYFGDQRGAPGTAITFFEWPGVP